MPSAESVNLHPLFIRIKFYKDQTRWQPSLIVDFKRKAACTDQLSGNNWATSVRLR